MRRFGPDQEIEERYFPMKPEDVEYWRRMQGCRQAGRGPQREALRREFQARGRGRQRSSSTGGPSERPPGGVFERPPSSLTSPRPGGASEQPPSSSTSQRTDGTYERTSSPSPSSRQQSRTSGGVSEQPPGGVSEQPPSSSTSYRHGGISGRPPINQHPPSKSRRRNDNISERSSSRPPSSSHGGVSRRPHGGTFKPRKDSRSRANHRGGARRRRSPSERASSTSSASPTSSRSSTDGGVRRRPPAADTSAASQYIRASDSEPLPPGGRQPSPPASSSFGRGRGRGRGRHASPPLRLGVRRIEVETAPVGYQPEGYRSVEQTSSLETSSEHDNDDDAFDPSDPETNVWVGANLPDLTVLDNTADLDEPVAQHANDTEPAQPPPEQQHTPSPPLVVGLARPQLTPGALARLAATTLVAFPQERLDQVIQRVCGHIRDVNPNLPPTEAETISLAVGFGANLVAEMARRVVTTAVTELQTTPGATSQTVLTSVVEQLCLWTRRPGLDQPEPPASPGAAAPGDVSAPPDVEPLVISDEEAEDD